MTEDNRIQEVRNGIGCGEVLDMSAAALRRAQQERADAAETIWTALATSAARPPGS